MNPWYILISKTNFDLCSIPNYFGNQYELYNLCEWECRKKVMQTISSEIK